MSLVKKPDFQNSQKPKPTVTFYKNCTLCAHINNHNAGFVQKTVWFSKLFQEKITYFPNFSSQCFQPFLSKVALAQYIQQDAYCN